MLNVNVTRPCRSEMAVQKWPFNQFPKKSIAIIYPTTGVVLLIITYTCVYADMRAILTWYCAMNRPLHRTYHTSSDASSSLLDCTFSNVYHIHTIPMLLVSASLALHLHTLPMLLALYQLCGMICQCMWIQKRPCKGLKICKMIC